MDRDLVGGRKEGAGIEPLKGHEVGRSPRTDLEAVAAALAGGDGAGDRAGERPASRLGERRKVQPAPEPDPRLNPGVRSRSAERRRTEPDDHGGYRLAVLRRDDRHRDHLVDRLLARARLPDDIARLRPVRERRKRQLGLFAGPQQAGGPSVGRRDHPALLVEEAVVQGMDRTGRPRGPRLGTHDPLHLVVGARIQKVRRSVLQRRMDARLSGQNPAAFGEVLVPQALDRTERGELGLELPTKIEPGRRRQIPLREEERRDRDD